MSGSVGRLKAVVEIVGKEVVRELRKNKFFNYLEDKGKIGDRTIVLQTPNKIQHTELTLEKKIHPLLLPGFELATF